VNFPLNIYLISIVGGTFTTLLTLPLWQSWCRRVGLVDDPGHRKIHTQAIPLAGGLAVLTGILLPLTAAVVAVKCHLLNAQSADSLAYGLTQRASQLAALLGGAVAMTCLGALDDKHELRPALKFTGQFLIAAMVAAAGVRITLFVPSLVFSYAITILWILTVTNAFNFMDFMNGLCTGLGAIAALIIAIASARHEYHLVAALSFLVGGATLGFLPWNFPRASAFLGDAGSHLVGFLLSVLAILPHFYSEKHPHTLAVLSPLLILAIPLTDLAWVVLLRLRLGKPFYVGDTNHLSHRLVRAGLTNVQAVILIWIVAAGVGVLVFLF
jgi:UDP-GlcNAc:undecaprenyl-phosphate GlcNAc-1-phosphate transferase